VQAYYARHINNFENNTLGFVAPDGYVIALKEWRAFYNAPTTTTLATKSLKIKGKKHNQFGISQRLIRSVEFGVSAGQRGKQTTF